MRHRVCHIPTLWCIADFQKIIIKKIFDFHFSSMNKGFKIYLLGLISIGLIVISCSTSRQEFNSFYDFDYDYELRRYYSDDLKNHKSAQFYLDGKLIRATNRDGVCTQYYYDENDKLIETKWGRNCSYGRRCIYIFDSTQNHVGYYYTLDSIVNIDTIQFEQIFYYNSKNQLIKERTHQGTAISDKEFETWNYYAYSDDLRKTLITMSNSDTLWKGTYSYDSLNNLVAIHKKRNDVYETISYTYNSNGLVNKEEIKSTANPVTEITSFSAGNHSKIYEYDSSNQLISETIINHNGEVQFKNVYKKVYKPK